MGDRLLQLRGVPAIGDAQRLVVPLAGIGQAATASGKEPYLALVDGLGIQKAQLALVVHRPGIGPIVMACTRLRRCPPPGHEHQEGLVAGGFERQLHDLAAQALAR
ncbi:hypothetical protein D3C81_1770310 [compost metagenome]